MRLHPVLFLLAVVFALPAVAQEAAIHQDADVVASSSAGGKYAAAKATDNNRGTRWASANHAPLPQWLELRFAEPRTVDFIYLHLAADKIYSPWARLDVSFSDGDPVTREIEVGEDIMVLRFPPRETTFLRITVSAVHDERNYVGIYECFAAHDPGHDLGARTETPKPVSRADLEIRGRAEHPSVNLTPADVAAARERVGKFAWAKEQRDAIVAEADKWLREDGEYWLSFLPEPGACYAYGFTGCPICDGSTGKWHGARCSWDEPGKVTCVNGHTLPDAEYPDDGTGYTAPDGRIHYFKGQFNAWVTEQWTQYALPSLTQAWLLTEDARYAKRAALLLDALASVYKESTSGSWDYPSDPPSGRFARPWYQVARTLVRYVDFHDRLLTSSALEKPSLREGFTRRENIEQNMLMDGAYYCYDHAFAGALHNGHADYLRGALAVGCLLDIPEFIRIAVEGPFSIHTMLANNIDRDGRYYESSLGYGIHARELYLTFADPLYNLRNAEYPEGINLYDDPALRAAILLPDTQVMLAGRRPNFGDSAPDTRYIAPGPPQSHKNDRAFLERLHARTADPAARADYAGLLRWCGQQTGEPAPADPKWALWHGRDVGESNSEPALPAPYDQRVTGSWVAGMKGMAMLRGGEQAVLLRYGPSLNHGDPDDLGLTYYANGYQLSYDLGYGLGSTHAHVGWASSTVSHALVTINETNQLATDGSGGSLHWFADLPHVQAVSASSPLSYASEGITQYRRSVALVDGRYVVDVFQVEGGQQHDFGFGSIGTDLQPFGVPALKPQPGSLAEGYTWGEKIGADGDIAGYPNKPYWNPPPGNGYGFFKNVRRGQPGAHWGGEWTIPGDPGTRLRMHVVGDGAEAIFADAPGLYPSKPDASYVLVRREGEAPLSSTFIAVYEPFQELPILASIKRVGPAAVEVKREDGQIDVLLFGEQHAETSLGSVQSAGDLAYFSANEGKMQPPETLAAETLQVDGQPVDGLPGAFDATVTAVDPVTRSVTLDRTIPAAVGQGRVAVFSNPAYSRTTAYHVRAINGQTLELEAGSLTLGTGRAWEIRGQHTLLSDIPHEYAKHVKRIASRYFEGKILLGASGATTRVRAVQPGAPMTLAVDDATVFSRDERFQYLDIAPGDSVCVAMPAVGNRQQ